MKSFIMHYTPLVERKKHIIQQMDINGITNYEIIESHDREALSWHHVSKFSNLKLSEISLFLKHIEAMKKAVENPTETDIILIFEDDSVLVKDYKTLFNNCMNNLPENWDILFTSGCFDMHAKNIVPDKYFYDTNGSRGTCMYIINKRACEKVLSIFDCERSIKLPIDHWFNWICSKYHLKYYLSEPVLVLQGSEIGVFSSAIR